MVSQHILSSPPKYFNETNNTATRTEKEKKSKMKPEVTKKPYFLLAEPEALSDSQLNSLLGLAVENPYVPLTGTHRPRFPLKPRDGIDYLYPDKYTVCNDFRHVEKSSRSGRASTKLQRLVSVTLQKGGEQAVNLQAAGFRRISVRDAKTKIEDLLSEEDVETKDVPMAKIDGAGHNGAEGEVVQYADAVQEPPQHANAPIPTPTPTPTQTSGLLANLLKPFSLARAPPTPSPTPDPDLQETQRKAAQKAVRAQYRKEVLDLLQKQPDRKLAIITSIITCTTLSKVIDKTKLTSLDASAGTGPAAHPYTEVQVSAGYSRSHDVGTEGTYQDEHLIACSYHLLQMERPRKGFNLPWVNIKLVPKNTSDVQAFVSPEEMWHVSNVPIEGTTAVMLGAGGSDEEDGDAEVEGFGCLMYCEDDDEVSVSSGDDEEGTEEYGVARRETMDV